MATVFPPGSRMVQGFLAGALAPLLLAPGLALAQGAAVPDAAALVEAEKTWSARASVTGYFLQDGAYFVPVAAVDRAGVHLEARYNYEAQRAGSVWLGWTVEFGEALHLTLTPMFGGVFGELNGLGPGLEWSLAWKGFTLYSELELVVDLGPDAGTFFYVWTELDGRPVEWLRLGIALQRTRAIASPRLVQWGPLVGVEFWKLSMSAYWFNPGQSANQYWVLSLGINL